MNKTILCIGNSRAVNSMYTPYINKYYNVNSYNLAYNGLTIDIIKIFLEDYLQRHHVPELVFIEISVIMNTFSIANYADFNMYSNKSVQLKEKIKQTDKTKFLITHFFPILRYNNELLLRSLYYINKTDDQTWINRYKISEELRNEVMKMPELQMEIKQQDLLILKETIQKLTNKNIKVCLYLAPYLPEYLLKIQNIQQVLHIVEDITETLVIDLSDYLQQTEFFADRIHTNEEGAILISDTLMHAPCKK